MIIGVAGPYSAPTEEQKNKNAAAMNKAAAAIFSMGHTPLIGINAALPVIPYLDKNTSKYEAIMQISLAVIDRCEGLLLLAESPGANRERDLVLSKGLPVFHSIEELEKYSSSKNQKRRK